MPNFKQSDHEEQIYHNYVVGADVFRRLKTDPEQNIIFRSKKVLNYIFIILAVARQCL